MEHERNFWHKNVLNKFIIPPEKCSICNKGLMNIINNISINNPLISKCNVYKCGRTKYIRNGTIFAINNRTPVSVLYTILKIWIID